VTQAAPHPLNNKSFSVLFFKKNRFLPSSKVLRITRRRRIMPPGGFHQIVRCRRFHIAGAVPEFLGASFRAASFLP
jgi:hypothetical protein